MIALGVAQMLAAGAPSAGAEASALLAHASGGPATGRLPVPGSRPASVIHHSLDG
jgi:hypothetical protein